MNEVVCKHGSHACMSVCHVSACGVCTAGGDWFSGCVDGLDIICFPCFESFVKPCKVLGSGLPSQVPRSGKQWSGFPQLVLGTRVQFTISESWRTGTRGRIG